ncbi:MAG: methyltransferase, TIGR04325 family [Bacteroidales bacterium]|nr:methyltransferase, TIGR04325 family [Bacteroidales bacterium]
MINSLKTITKIFLYKINSSIKFKGNYVSWQEALANSTGYDSEIILNKVKEAALKVKNKQAAYERDGVLFYIKDYPFPLLSGLLRIASIYSGKLNVLDFGGSLGSTYFQCRDFFHGLKEIQWNVVEQENFVKVGKELFENNELKFFYSIDECLNKTCPTVIIFSGVLQCLEKPYVILDKVKSIFKHVIIDRTPFTEKEKDILTVQEVSPVIYKASYPMWLFSLKNFVKFLENDYSILTEFNALDGVRWFKRTKVFYKGFILEKK